MRPQNEAKMSFKGTNAYLKLMKEATMVFSCPKTFFLEIDEVTGQKNDVDIW